MDDTQNTVTATHFEELIVEIQARTTFTEVREWSTRSMAEIARVSGIIRGMDIEIARAAEALEHARREQAKKSLVGRLLGSSNNEEKEFSQHLEELRQAKSELVNAVTKLQDCLDFTPKSPDEQNALLHELRQRKKELQEKKREITAVIRGPHKIGLQPDGPAAMVFDAATLSRRKARYEREAELLPQEKTNEALNRQIARVDQDILWAEKFK